MPVRKAEPNAGEDTGFHFPLKTGTEVLISYRNGNPDRPVISGAMPNETHPSPVTGTNRTSNVIVTSSGARFEIDDASEDADAKVTIRNRSGDDASYLRLGKSSVDDATSLEAHYKDTYLSSQEGDGIFLYTPSNIVHAAANEQRTHASEGIPWPVTRCAHQPQRVPLALWNRTAVLRRPVPMAMAQRLRVPELWPRPIRNSALTRGHQAAPDGVVPGPLPHRTRRGACATS